MKPNIENARKLLAARSSGSPDLQTGLSMLEVLIALTVLSIGLAGLGLMHMSSLKYANSAYFRSVASTVAIDLEERLWLRMSDVTNVEDCPDMTSAGTAYTQLIADWKTRSLLTADGWHGFDARLAQIPSLNVELPDTAPDPVESVATGLEGKSAYIELPITLSWTESRFDFAEEGEASLPYDETDLSERYPYTIRVFCRGASTSPAPTTPG